jgi:hypothetical protein
MGEAFAFQPFSTIGILIAPVLIIEGIFLWFKFYKRSRGHYPRFILTALRLFKESLRNPLAMMEFMLKHLLEFWTFCIVFWVGMVILMFLTFRQSDAFEATKTYCENDGEIIDKTGEIYYYGVLVGGTMTTKFDGTGHAEMSFTIVGKKGNFTAKSFIERSDSYWEVSSVKIN